MKLSDTQLMILSSASQRTDHAAVLPANLKGSAANKVVNKLLNEKLLQELRAKDDMPVWRRGDDNRPYSLRVTPNSLSSPHREPTRKCCDISAKAVSVIEWNDSTVGLPICSGLIRILVERLVLIAKPLIRNAHAEQTIKQSKLRPVCVLRFVEYNKRESTSYTIGKVRAPG
jgi:hypothetical protein